MTLKLPISVTIITNNEADRLPRALESVSPWADEIIVIDSGSTDNTRIIAQTFGATFIHNDWCGYGLQKRFAEDQSTHDWILNIDADERISPALAAEIQSTLQNTRADGYAINIHDHIYGTDDYAASPSYSPIRLYNKTKGRYSTNAVHDRVQMQKNTTVHTMHGVIHHDSIRSFTHRVDKLNAYSSKQAHTLSQSNRSFPFIRLVFEFTVSFWRSYLLKGRFRRGTLGFIHAMNYAYSRFLRLAKLYEIYFIEKKNK